MLGLRNAFHPAIILAASIATWPGSHHSDSVRMATDAPNSNREERVPLIEGRESLQQQV
jgi:hypothetical protein